MKRQLNICAMVELIIGYSTAIDFKVLHVGIQATLYTLYIVYVYSARVFALVLKENVLVIG